MSLDKDVFYDRHVFESAFQQRLTGILHKKALGAFILACANASSQPDLLTSMATAIDRQFHRLKDHLQSGGLDNTSPEDRQVFESLIALGLENLPATEHRQLGPWSVQYNTMRGFRHTRHATDSPETLLIPFDTDGFSFNKPFMLQERFWQGTFCGHSLTAYYNKFPFADYHLLWVPDRELGQSQYLQQAYHYLIWQLVEELLPVLPGFAIGYSSIGACASVNHLHFQSFTGKPLAVTDPCWRHNGGMSDYPLQAHVFTQAEDAWAFIAQLHQQNLAYNLLYSHNRIYCLPRQKQGRIEQPLWSPGFAWREVSGEMLSLDRKAYLHITREDIESSLSCWRIEV